MERFPSLVRAMKFHVSPFYKTLLSLGCAGCTLGTLLFLDSRPILIESEESKTVKLKPVFNRILFEPGLKKDTWVMQQSHSGSQAPEHEWDRIAIVVDKEKAEAEFFQLIPGDLKSPDLTKKLPLRASCFMCHSNGPRAIRPNVESLEAKLSLWNRARLLAWNLRVKSYGKLNAANKEPSFHLQEKGLNVRLEVKACTKCHKDEGLFSRGALTREQFTAIRFMLDNGHMPPPGFSLTAKEKREINKFIGS